MLLFYNVEYLILHNISETERSARVLNYLTNATKDGTGPMFELTGQDYKRHIIASHSPTEKYISGQIKGLYCYKCWQTLLLIFCVHTFNRWFITFYPTV